MHQKNNFNRNNHAKKCFNCGKHGHLSKDCRLKPIKMANTLQVEMSCAVKINQETIPQIVSMLENNQLKLADGSKIDIITNACQKVNNKEKQMPVMQGKIGNNQVQT